MDIEIKTWLYDILQSISEIESYFEERPKIFENYIKDLKTKRAVERNIEIIGEATNRIFKKKKVSNLRTLKRLLEPAIGLYTGTIRFQTI